MDKLVIYTDGACRNNQATDKSLVIGGWGYILMYKENKKEAFDGKKGNTTNNEMELTALLESLKALKSFNFPTEIYIDSQYVVNSLTKWRYGWQKNGWINSKGQTVANKELIQEVISYIDKFKDVKIFWTKGHADNEYNIRVDQLANLGCDKYC